MIGDAQIAIRPWQWSDAINKLRIEGRVNWPLYQAVDFALIAEAKLQHEPYYYPALAEELHRELCRHGPRRAR